MNCSYTSRILMSKTSIKNVLKNLFLMFGRGKTQNRAKIHRPSMSAFSPIFVLKENGTQSHSAKFLKWGDHVNSVPPGLRYNLQSRSIFQFSLQFKFKKDRLQIIVVAKKYIYVSQLFISRMPKMRTIPQLVSAPLNPIPIAEYFRRSQPPCEHSRG